MKTTGIAIFIALIFAVIFLSACTTGVQNQAANTDGSAVAMEKTTTVSTTENEDAMMGISYMLKDNKMMVVEDSKEVVMESDVTLADGTKVMMNGKIVKSDGSEMMLENGQSVWEDGSITSENDMMEKTEDAANEDNSDNSMMTSYSGKILAGKTTPYIEFNKKDYDDALAENKVIVLNFYANWCPTCKAEQPSAFAAFDKLDNDKVVGFRVNYKDSDTDSDETALAAEFGIPYQHIKVIIKDGSMVLKSPETWDTERYVDEIAKYS